MSTAVITRRNLLATASWLLFGSGFGWRALATARPPRLPNIILLYADDLGFGDLGCYGATAVATPNLDRLAKQGITFNNGHAPAATCTPSRYSLLTGDYAWRREGARVLPGDAPALIRPGTFTLPAMLKRAGYTTGLVGKWHLGLGDGAVNWNGSIRPGPLEIGFDYGYFIPATIDRVPTVYVEGHEVVNLDPRDPIDVDYRHKVGDEPTGAEHPELLRLQPSEGHDGTIVGGVSRIGYMSGGHAARWVDEAMADTLVGKAEAFIEEHRAGPFFLYFATNEIHVPRLPAKRFQGKSGMGPRGDSILELDWIAGEVTKTLDRFGLSDETLIIFSSDNGPVLDDGYKDRAGDLVGNHRPAGPFRSGKYSVLDGGSRIPLMARWPGTIPAGISSNALIDQVDLLASLASLVGQPLPDDGAADSQNQLSALLGRSFSGRDYVVEQANAPGASRTVRDTSGSSLLAIVEGRWKAIEPWGPPAAFHGNDLGTAPAPQLYDLHADPGERTNLAARFPQRTAEMLARLKRIRMAGKSR